jgi:mono/diheme cytochrome c family protein
MSVTRLVACSGALVLMVAVHVAGQQPARGGAASPAAAATQPGARGGAAPQAGGGRAAGGSVERGRYLVERVVMCAECHSTRDAQGNIVPGTRFMGGSMPMRPSWGGDWPQQIPRIAGFAGYTDEEAMRVLTQGAIRRDGTQLRLPMPRFRMTPQDAADVIAYLRTL